MGWSMHRHGYRDVYGVTNTKKRFLRVILPDNVTFITHTL